VTLRNLSPTPFFNTSTDEVAHHFLVPALSNSTRYDRGVGYFSSAWLRMVSAGLIGLAQNEGTARIVASPKLAPQDWAALLQGSDAQNDPNLHAALSRTINELASDLNNDTLTALAWLVADGILEFRIAVPAGDLDGDFHDKFGQFHDSVGNSIAFNGSPNDSERAFRNYESISCFYSWLDERESIRVASEVERFDKLWSNRDANVRVYPLPDAVRRNLIQFTERRPRPYRPKGVSSTQVQDPKWRHQKEALAVFIEKTHGILAMATGTGKTRTAISILNELKDRDAISMAIVTMSGTDLLDQWRKELAIKSPFPVYKAFAEHKEQQQFINDPRDALLLISRQMLPAVLSRLPENALHDSLIICDEVHGLGSDGLVRSLRGRIKPFKYRLGLSATPDREYDPDGNLFIEDEIGPTIFNFGLEDAIERGILCELDYVALEYTLSADDRLAIRTAIRSHHARNSAGLPSSPEDLYRQIAAVRKSTLTKLPPFEEYLNKHPAILNRCLIFVDNKDFGIRVQELLLKVTGRFHTYFADDDREHLVQFSRGETDCLVTCHRISEGIDIRSVNNVILFASSRAKLETIQRLGRCLRIDNANPNKRALVLDFVESTSDEVTSDASDMDESADQERQQWFQKIAQVRRGS
jgi:superfamily II DNA or RNA helicase